MTTDTLSSTPVAAASVQRIHNSELWQTGLLAILLAIIANLVLYAVATPFVNVPPEFLPLSGPVPTIMFTAFGVLAAVIVFAIVGRLTRKPARVYTIVATIALLLSLIPNISMLVDPASAPFPGSNPGSVTVLMLQHVVAAVVAVWVLTTRGIERTPADK